MFFLRKIISSAIRLQYRKEHLPKNLHFSESVLLNSRMPRILAARCASCNCMTYFYCAPLQSCRRLYQLGD
ncbi:hypothetical protein DWX78_05270 [Dorea formicigenerans]|uniref:Uncharacterized protein n=1 Tax=Dorea formicigenerans TaxID=39486 RepID=A0A412KS60_9FIRM|nr:hypothetical protein DWX78_05270 [Dorea formicigenerans]